MESKAKPSSIVPDSSGLGAKDWVTVVMESYPFDNTTGARRNNGTPQDPMLLEGHRTSPPLVTGAVADFLVSSGSAGRVATASSLENAPMNENMEPYSIGRETHISPEDANSLAHALGIESPDDEQNGPIVPRSADKQAAPSIIAAPANRITLPVLRKEAKEICSELDLGQRVSPSNMNREQLERWIEETQKRLSVQSG